MPSEQFFVHPALVDLKEVLVVKNHNVHHNDCLHILFNFDDLPALCFAPPYLVKSLS